MFPPGDEARGGNWFQMKQEVESRDKDRVCSRQGRGPSVDANNADSPASTDARRQTFLPEHQKKGFSLSPLPPFLPPPSLLRLPALYFLSISTPDLFTPPGLSFTSLCPDQGAATPEDTFLSLYNKMKFTGITVVVVVVVVFEVLQSTKTK